MGFGPADRQMLSGIAATLHTIVKRLIDMAATQTNLDNTAEELVTDGSELLLVTRRAWADVKAEIAAS